MKLLNRMRCYYRTNRAIQRELNIVISEVLFYEKILGSNYVHEEQFERRVDNLLQKYCQYMRLIILQRELNENNANR